jgi:hypothetical protein
MTQTPLNQTEEKIRSFLSEELMKDWASTISYTETFQLDSIDQVDLRVFLEETFYVQFTAEQKPFQNLQMILDLVGQKS